MSYGLLIRNQNGAVVIDSDYRHTVFVDKFTPQIVDVGAYDGQLSFGRLVELGFLSPSSYPQPGYLYWFRLPAGQWCFPGAWMFKPGQVEFLRTSRTLPIQKGRLNVYNGAGSLVWSDVSSYDMPRIRGFIQPSLNVSNAVESIQPGFNPWILMNNCHGTFSDDGTVTGYSGMFFRWDGTTLQYRWENKNQRTFADVYGNRTILKIPYAFFNYGR